jgi:hypothetical protein
MARTQEIAIALVAGALAGCTQLASAMIVNGQPYNSTYGQTVRGGIYTGPECRDAQGNPIGQVRYDSEKHDRVLEGQRRSLDQPIEKQIAGLICVHAVDGSEAIIQQHDAFDDRHYDHLAAAMMILDCDVSTACNLQRGQLAVGLMSWYVEHTDLDQVAKALEDVPLSAKARQFFLKRTEQAQQHIQTMAAQLDRRQQHLYIAVPNAVHAARASYFKAREDLYARLDAVVEHAEENRKKGRESAAVYNALEGLRAEYLTDCGKEECRFDPFFVDATRELVLLHLAGRDPIGVLAENALLHEDDANRNGYGPSIQRALYTALEKERDDHIRYEQAKRQGVDESALRQSFGGSVPLDVEPSDVWQSKNTLPDYAAAVRDDSVYEMDRISVSAVDVKAEIATLKPSYGDPVYVPAAEGKDVRDGEQCTVVMTRKDRDGMIVRCDSRSKITQLRGTRLK